MEISIIVAASINNAIGKNNNLLCRLSNDLKRFKKITMGHHILMGRKTFESIGKPLPGRTTVIITRQKDYTQEGCKIANSIEEAINLCQDTEIFIIGGGEIYNQAFNIVNNIYLTRIHSIIDGDTFIPNIDDDNWQEVNREDFLKDEKNEFDYSFINYKKKL
ncbi:MAG: dihydrofolate reductase [Marinifilaceae bacterium]|jgi:dihydrofolate reductase|nr:dihydrofolate reductase [Marinifilaceae bacterium]